MNYMADDNADNSFASSLKTADYHFNQECKMMKYIYSGATATATATIDCKLLDTI